MRGFIRNKVLINLITSLTAFTALWKSYDISRGATFEQYFKTHCTKRLGLYSSHKGLSLKEL